MTSKRPPAKDAAKDGAKDGTTAERSERRTKKPAITKQASLAKKENMLKELYTQGELKGFLNELKQPTTGNKTSLIHRLVEASSEPRATHEEPIKRDSTPRAVQPAKAKPLPNTTRAKKPVTTKRIKIDVQPKGPKRPQRTKQPNPTE